MMTRPYVLGLTGNIATGKSTVARMLGELGAQVIDCDRLAHELMAPRTAVNAAVSARFKGVQQSDGAIDRARLGEIVFSDAEALADLETLVHPAVIEEAWQRAASSEAPVVVVEAIKLFEAGMDRRCDQVWTVDATEEIQLQRLMVHRDLSFVEAEQRIAAQPDSSEKLARADRIIANSGSLTDTWRQVRRGWQELPGAPELSADRRLPRELRRKAVVEGRRVAMYWAALALFFCVWAAINWINAGLSAGQKVFVLALCALTAGGCAWIVARW